MGEASYKSDTLPSSEYSSERSVSSSSSSVCRLAGREPEHGVGRRRGAGGRHQVHDHDNRRVLLVEFVILRGLCELHTTRVMTYTFFNASGSTIFIWRRASIQAVNA